MKKLLTSAGILFSCITLVQAQFALSYETHALQAGDNHHFIIAKNTHSEGASGANVTWDFTTLDSEKSLVSHMLKSNETAAGKDIPEANTVIQEWDNKFYFKVSKGLVEQYGVASCGNSIIKYDEPFVKMVFPFRYKDVYEGSFSGTLLNGSNSTPSLGNYRLEVDAYGTLRLPNGTYKNVLRLKEIRSEAFGSCNGVTNITYRWYCKDVRYPLLTIIEQVDGPKTIITKTAYYAGTPKNLKSTEESEPQVLTNDLISLTANPNPFTNSFKIEYILNDAANLKMELYDNTGKKIETLINNSMEAGNYSMDVDANSKGMQPGMYYIKVQANDQVLNYKIIQVK